MVEKSEHTTEGESTVQRPAFPATVIAVPDHYSVAINRGIRDGIKKGMNFLVYGLSKEEIIDPETKEKLGYLEIVRGTGSVSHVQEKIATITSNQRSRSRRVIKRGRGLWSALNEEEIVEGEGVLLALDDPEVGDKARPI